MQLPSLSIALLSLMGAASTAQAWELTAYSNTRDCNPSQSPAFRVLTGAPSLTNCFTFTRDMPGTGCTHWSDFGRTRSNCDRDSFQYPASVWIRGGFCAIFNAENCDSNNGASAVIFNNVCGNLPVAGNPNALWPIRSYWCSG